MSPVRRKRPALPRAPLPKQRGGVHPDRTKVVPRKQKYRKPTRDSEPEE